MKSKRSSGQDTAQEKEGGGGKGAGGDSSPGDIDQKTKIALARDSSKNSSHSTLSNIVKFKDTKCSSSDDDEHDNNDDYDAVERERCKGPEEEPRIVAKSGVQVSGVGEGIAFPTTCPSCQNTTTTNMCITNIPYFKEVIIMALTCEQCGYKSNEIKGGVGAIPKLGTKIVLTAQDGNDLNRDVLKSDTAGIEIPELELVLDEGGLDGMYTTVEGLLDKIHTQLEYANPFKFSDGDDSAATNTTTTTTTKGVREDNDDEDDGCFRTMPSSNTKKRYLDILEKVEAMKSGNSFPFTLIITDPLSNSFVSPIPQYHFVPDATFCEENENWTRRDELNNNHTTTCTDRCLDIKQYERSHEQNEVLGLNDMKTENYHDN